MAWLYEKSATWRKIVAVTRQSPLAMSIFGVSCFAVPYGMAKLAMWGTNPENDAAKERLLRERSSLSHQVLAKANRERLAVLLGELQRKEGGDERYAAALDGRSLGTHSLGTSTGARSIQPTLAASRQEAPSKDAP
ncbi:hypothetical protein WJX72_004525 [[Myrmecia] bisecta]|uniref:Uncharacterized protein n=1 Tax=[Myrmecia] bisecta TaxID=41462 RepID=A0AAW1Q8R6_9CHLO